VSAPSPRAQCDALKALIGHEVGTSPWYTLDADAVAHHAQYLGDDEWIHTDADRAAAADLGAPIAQGFLVLSQLTRMGRCLELPLEGVSYRLHYGFDRVRMIQPVPVGSRVQGRFELKAATPRGSHGVLLSLAASIWMEQDDIAPALVAEWLVYLRLA